MMNAFVYLMLAIISEVIATSSLKVAEGFTRPIPSIIVIMGYATSFYLLSLALKSIPLGTAYAIWSGLGTAGIVFIGVLVWKETLDAPRIIGILLIITGVIILNVFAEGKPIT